MPIYPFSILDTRTKEWKERKNWWITNYKIQSELGREKYRIQNNVLGYRT